MPTIQRAQLSSRDRSLAFNDVHVVVAPIGTSCARHPGSVWRLTRRFMRALGKRACRVEPLVRCRCDRC